MLLIEIVQVDIANPVADRVHKPPPILPRAVRLLDIQREPQPGHAFVQRAQISRVRRAAPGDILLCEGQPTFRRRFNQPPVYLNLAVNNAAIGVKPHAALPVKGEIFCAQPLPGFKIPAVLRKRVLCAAGILRK